MTQLIHGRLTPQQRRILAFVAEGKSNKLIAGQLHLSSTTIQHHLSWIYAVLGAENRAHAVHLAHEYGLLGGDDETPLR